MSAVLDELAKKFIDAPLLLPVTDAAVLAARTEGALVVVSAGKTRDTQFRHARGLIKQVNGHTLGVVLNRVPRRDSDSGFCGT